MEGMNNLTEPLRAGGPKWHYLLVGVLAGLIMLYNLGGKTLEDHEAMMALTARTMAQPAPDPWMLECPGDYTVPPLTPLNHWLVPVENGYPRLVKTPLAYWVAGGIGRAYAALGFPGQPINNFTARLGSALAAVTLVCVTLALGRRLFSPRAALLAAAMLAVSVGLQKWGKNARPEMLLCLLMTVSMACFYNGLHAPTRRRRAIWMIAFWIFMGLANLAKEFVPLLLAWPLLAYLAWRSDNEVHGDETALSHLRKFILASFVGLAAYIVLSVAMPSAGGGVKYGIMALALGAPMLWLFIVSRGHRQVLPLLPTALPGMLLMLAMFVPWMLYMQHLFPTFIGGTLTHQVTDRAAGTGGWNSSNPVTYLNAVLVFTLPWIAFLPGAFAVALMKRFGDDRRQLTFLLLWVLGIVLLFSASAGKREHYILPTLPALCLLLGYIADDVFFRHRWITPAQGRGIAIGYGIAGLLALPICGGLWAVAAHGDYWLSALPKGSKHELIETIVNLGDFWPLAMITAAAAAVPLLLAAISAWRRKLSAVPALMVVAFAIMHLGNWLLAPRWDERLPIATFAQKARAMLPPGQELCSQGEADPVVAFYFDRYIPTATSTVPCKETPYLLGIEEDAASLEALGYKRLLEIPQLMKSNSQFVVFRWEFGPQTGRPDAGRP